MRFDLNIPADSEPLLSLGNLCDAGALGRKVLDGTHYGNLKRHAKLPILRKLNKMKKVKNKDVRKTITDVSNGKCIGEYLFIEEGARYTLVLKVETVDTSMPSYLRGNIFDACFQGMKMQMGVELDNSMGGVVHSDEFKHGTDTATQTLLNYRLVHLFVRKYGVLLGQQSFESLDTICTSISGIFRRAGELELALDATMVLADLAIILGVDYRIVGDRISKVGECLEAMGKHLDAAKVYTDVANTVWKHSIFCGQAYTNAGLAFKYAQDFDKAESSYVLAWNTVVHANSNPMDAAFAGILQNILILYHQYNASRKRSNERSEGKEKLFPVLCSLLKIIGFRSQNESLTSCVLDTGVIGCLRTNLRNPGAALKVLRNAAVTPTLDYFRNSILASAHPDVGIITSSGGVENPSDPKHHAQTMKENNERSHKSNFTSHSCITCNKHEEPGGQKLFRCPCKVVHYCSKDCQLENWMDHKKHCTFQLKKKEEKKKRSGR